MGPPLAAGAFQPKLHLDVSHPISIRLPSHAQTVLANLLFGNSPMKNEIIRIGQIEIKFLLEAADTNGSVAMFEFTVPVGAKMPLPHSHKHYDEIIYGVQGVVTFTAEG